ncbi:MAG: proteasome-activating nucleotidase [Candidatus Thermoplasmatota archaeon]|nr:proteasome-activating nucleotidase [Candidatus Thermoplasmatota archaeon]
MEVEKVPDVAVDEIIDRLESLQEDNLRLIEEARRLENEKHYLETDNLRLQREIQRLKAELARIKRPPLIVGSIKDILGEGQIVVKSSTGPDFSVTTAEHIRPETMVIGARVALNKQTLTIMGVLPPSVDPIVSGAEVIEKPQVSYGDVGGLKDQLVELREAVEYPLLRPEKYIKVGIEPPKGVLLVGPPGTGKTLLAKAVAHQTNATFIRLVGSELVQKYIGEGARLVRELFEMANEKSPSIVFIDEIDAVGAKRLDAATSGDREVQRTLMQLLSEMDGFEPLSGVKIIAATNRPDILDDALLRPGRFDRIIEIPPPDEDARKEIFRIHTRKMNIVKSIDVEYLAVKTEGCTGADIKSICTEAGMFAIRDDRQRVRKADFDSAIKKVLEGDLGEEPGGYA